MELDWYKQYGRLSPESSKGDLMKGYYGTNGFMFSGNLEENQLAL